MINDIQEALKEIEEHLENISEIITGVPEEIEEDVLMQVLTAASSLEEAHDHLK